MRRLVLGIAVAVTSLIPVVGMADDQQIADFIKSRLHAEQQLGNLKGFNVDMRVENGTVWFSGQVSTADQEMLVLRTAQKAGNLGVIQVVDNIDVVALQAPVQVDPVQSAAQSIPASATESAPVPVGYQHVTPQGIPAIQVSAATPRTAPPTPATIGNEPLAVNAPYGGYAHGDVFGSAPVPAPVPNGYGGGGVPGATGGSPSLPGYAWPSYAAHPNFGNVAYPQQYSPSAWPYIGPFYPYPQVPLGWRKVTLEWDDGFWMLDFHDK